MNIRPFEDRDYERMAAIWASLEPERSRDAEWFRQRDASWNPEMLRLRLVAESDGLVVAWGDVFNTWWMYHPRKFQLRLNVDPPSQEQGIGSAVYARLMEHVESNWNPLRVNCETRETQPRSMRFAEHRGFHEVARRWESALIVANASLDRLDVVNRRLAENGIGVTTIAEERARRGDGQLQRDLFDLEQLIYLDEPGYDPEGALQFDQFVANELDPHVLLAEASYLALDGERLVGLSRMERERANPHRLHVGFTGVRPEYRGRGIATALKLRTLGYARAHGVTEIRTTNDSSNTAMLHINEALGFQRQPAWVVFEKHYA